MFWSAAERRSQDKQLESFQRGCLLAALWLYTDQYNERHSLSGPRLQWLPASITSDVNDEVVVKLWIEHSQASETG